MSSADLKEQYLDELQTMYFTKYAKNNEDFDGFDRWSEALSDEEVVEIARLVREEDDEHDS